MFVPERSLQLAILRQIQLQLFRGFYGFEGQVDLFGSVVEMRGDSYGIEARFVDAADSDAVFVHQVGLQVCVGDVGKAEGSYGAVGGGFYVFLGPILDQPHNFYLLLKHLVGVTILRQIIME